MGRRTPLSAAGPGCIVWPDLSRPRRGDGHRGGCYCTSIAVAESPLSSVSSARSGGNASTTSSSSMSAICAACCPRIFNIITRAGRISRSTRIARNPVRYIRQPRAGSLPSQRSAVCIIATNDALRELQAGDRTHTPASRWIHEPFPTCFTRSTAGRSVLCMVHRIHGEFTCH